MAGDPNFDSVKLLCGFEGADGSTTFVDESSVGRTLTGAGSTPEIDTAQFKFGSSSLLLDGPNGRVTADDAADLELGSGHFTLECFARWSADVATEQRRNADHRITAIGNRRCDNNANKR
jgi:hypothetical protein